VENTNLEELKNRLVQLESRLKGLLEISSRDLEIAKRLQALVVKNRLPSIPGIELIARHFSGSDMSAESFDVIPTKDFREIFIVAHWTESFGLSSVLLQAMVQLQTRAAIDSHPNLSTEALFGELKNSLLTHDENAQFRLSIFRLDVHSLKYSLYSKGFFPWISLSRGHWKTINDKEFSEVPVSTLSAKPQAEIFHTEDTLAPGTKLFFISSEWNFYAKSTNEFLAPLAFNEIPSNASLLDTINELMLRCENKIKSEELNVDLTALGLLVDSRKIHLA